MKSILFPGAVALSVMLLVSGCISIGSGSKAETSHPTVGQQLVDLQKARDAGAISEAEYQAQKQKLLDRQK